MKIQEFFCSFILKVNLVLIDSAIFNSNKLWNTNDRLSIFDKKYTVKILFKNFK